MPSVPPRQLALDALESRLHAALQRSHARRIDRLCLLESSLYHLNPEAVLQRGYAMVRDEAGQLVRDAAGLRIGDKLELVLATGRAAAEVRDTRP